jgi:hypothetical protein
MRFLAIAALVPLCCAGTRPRPASTDYRAQDTVGDVTLAAEILPPNQVRNLFSTDLSKYVVVEVAVYPKDATTVDVHKMDFAIKLGSGEVVRAANPAAIARTRQQASTKPPGKASDVNVYTTVGVGYESGSDRNGVNRKGVYTETGVAVAVGQPVGQPPYPQPPPPASTNQDRQTMQMELEDNGLPESPASKALAGYLYFPTSTKKTVTYDLEYYAPQGRTRLILK